MAIQFGAANVTIDRGQNTDQFHLQTSIPLPNPITDSSGNVVRKVENDTVGSDLYNTVAKELDLIKPLLDGVDDVELRFTRVPNPGNPTDPQKDTLMLKLLQGGSFQPGMPYLGGIKPNDFGQQRFLQVVGLLRGLLK